ncbi:AMP-binding protein [Streptomyces sp. NPDC004838]
MSLESDAARATWEAIEGALSVDPSVGFNTAVEACGRHADDPGRVAFVVAHPDREDEVWTYARLEDAASRAARVFEGMGLRRGDRVAGLLSRQAESWVTALAAWRSGLVYVPLFGGFAPDGIGWRIEQSRAGAVVVDHAYLDAFRAAARTLNSGLHVLVVTPPGARPGMAEQSFWDAVDSATPDGPQAHTTLGDPATLLFTSGTSGTPKACLMPHAALLSIMPYAKHVLGLRAGELLFSTSDPAWAYGLYTTGLAPMALGVRRLVYSGPFSPEAWWDLMHRHRVDALSTAPAAIRRLSSVMDSAGVPATLRTVATSGEQLAASVAIEWKDGGGPPILDAYGLSEVGMVLGDLTDPAATSPAGRLAGPMPGFDAMIVDRDGRELPPGVEGLVGVRRPRHQMSSTYENVPEAWAARWRGDVFVTEDRAVIDGNGHWRILGRDDDMIIASGHNISPGEVESAVLRHPAVAEAAVVAAELPGRGIVVRAVVVLVPQASVPDGFDGELRRLVTEHVGRYATPKVVDIVDALPRTAVGKLRRGALR